jgi:hypothetical protein
MPKIKAAKTVTRARGGKAKAQPVAQEARGELVAERRLGDFTPPEGHVFLAKQHGLTQEEAEKLFQTFQELQNLGKLIKFGQDQSAVFSDPFPEITVSIQNDDFTILRNPPPRKNHGRADGKAGQGGKGERI